MTTTNQAQTAQPSQAQPTSSDGNHTAVSGSNENKSTTDGKNKPAAKKPRKTDAERLKELKQKLKNVAAAERTVRARLRKSDNKDLDKLRMVLGDCCLQYIGGSPKPANADALVKLLRGSVRDCNKEWLSINLDRLVERHATPPQEGGDANGKSPSQP